MSIIKSEVRFTGKSQSKVIQMIANNEQTQDHRIKIARKFEKHLERWSTVRWDKKLVGTFGGGSIKVIENGGRYTATLWFLNTPHRIMVGTLDIVIKRSEQKVEELIIKESRRVHDILRRSFYI